MTTYEKFKAGALVCLCFLLLSVAMDIHHIERDAADGILEANAKLSATQNKASAVLDSFAGVGPQLTATLKTLQTTTNAVGKQATASLKVTDKVGTVLDGATATLDAVNRPCAELRPVTATTGGFYQPLKPCGTLADLNRTLATVRGTFGQIEVAANHEDKNLTSLDAQEAQLYADTHASIKSFNSLLSSPDITRFLKSSADTSTQVAAIATDVHREADKLSAPQPWYKKVYTYGNTGVNVACLVTHSCPF
jgi:ABC-type transporter Mla subunit MlaD